MKLIIISAISSNGVIGIGSEIPWHVPEDFKHYRETTMGCPVIVGLNTFKTLPEKALEGRLYLVLCGEGKLFENDNNNVHLFETMDDLKNYIDHDLVHYDGNVYIAGGAMMYNQFIEVCDEVIITWIDKIVNFAADADVKMFPILKLIKNFSCAEMGKILTSKKGVNYKIFKYKKSDHVPIRFR